jgi:hypothetical protein
MKTEISVYAIFKLSCLYLFRELPELAKIFVIRLIMLNQEVPVNHTTVNSWVDPKFQK